MLTDVIDLSVPFYEGMPTDDLGPKIWTRLSYAASRQLYQYTQSREGRVFLTTDHTGTHLDGPLRFDRAGTPIEQIPLERFFLRGRLIDCRRFGRKARIGRAELAAAASDLSAGDAAVLWTGHDLHIKHPDYFWVRPQLTEDGATWLAERGVAMVAADFPGLGEPGDDRFRVKRILHRAGAMTAEQLCNLAALAGREFTLFTGPLRVRGLAGSLIRAVGLVGFAPKQIADLTHEFFFGMPTLGATPTWWHRANHDLTHHFYGGELSYQTTSLFLSEHAGTHLDVPYHFDEFGPAIDEVPLTRLFVRAKMMDLTHKTPLEPIGPADFEAALGERALAIEPGEAAVVYTGHAVNYTRSPQTFGDVRPFITAEGAKWLAAKKPMMVATDLVGLDEPIDHTTPVHNALLHGHVCMLQVLTNLDRLLTGDWWIGAFPLKVVRGTGAPLRAFAVRQ